MWGGGNNCLLINNLHNLRGGFGFRTAALSCPDGVTSSGVAAFSPSEFSSNFYKPIIFSKKMKKIKKFNEQERQSYVPASVRVIEVTAQKVLCVSGENSTGFGNYNDGGSY